MGWADRYRPKDGWGAQLRCTPITKEFTAPAGPTSGLQAYNNGQVGGPTSKDKKKRKVIPVFITKAASAAEKIADDHEPALASRLERALNGLRSFIPRILRENKVPPDGFKDELDAAVNPVVAAAREGGKMTAANDNVTGGTGGAKIRFDFDHANPKVAQAIDGYKFDLIRQINDDTVAVIRRLIAEGQAGGQNPLDTARQLRDVIGLTDNQGQAVLNYRADLEQGNPNALTRALRDRRYDRTVQAAIDGKKTLEAEQIDAMVDAYRRRYISYRAMTIARTEAMRAVNTGSRAALQQAIDQGKIDPSWIRRTWLTARDERVRASHQHLDGQTVGWSEPYTLANGTTMRWPHDDQAPAALTINCRCTEQFTVTPPGTEE